MRPSLADVEYLLEATNAFFGTALGADDLAGAYAGVRPLISSGDTRKSVDISRKAELYETSSGLITITGGKLTTWRRMAKLAVDRLVERDGRDAPCRTAEIPLGQPIDPGAADRPEGVPRSRSTALARRYGHAAEQVLAVAAERGELAAADPPRAPRPARRGGVRGAQRAGARPSATCCCAGRASGCWPAARLSRPSAEAPLRVARALGAELGWDERRDRGREVRAVSTTEAAAEGIGLQRGGSARGPLRDHRAGRSSWAAGRG